MEDPSGIAAEAWDQGHEKAKVSALDLCMSKAPKQPRQRDGHKRLNDESAAPRSPAPARKPRSSPKHRAETVLDSVITEIPSAGMEGPEGGTPSSLPPARDDVLARARSLTPEGNQNGEDQQGSHNDIRDKAKPQVQAVAFTDVLASKEPDPGIASDLPRPSEDVEVRADPKQGPTPHHPSVDENKSGNSEDGKSLSRSGLRGTVQRAIRVWSPRLQAASDRVRGASGRVKVWTQGRSARRSQQTLKSVEATNPLYILAAITLGIPALLLIALVGMNPGVQDGAFAYILTFLVGSAFVVAMIFEIKRLADQPSNTDHH
jgi:hypothetical protein